MSLFEHERVCVGVWCLPALAIYLMGSARVISWHDMNWISEDLHGPRVFFFFFCQIWIVPRSLYFFSHCIRQTKNVREDFGKKKKRCFFSFTSHSLNLVWPVEEVVLLSKRSGKCHLEKSCPEPGRRWQICMSREDWHLKPWAGLFLLG